MGRKRRRPLEGDNELEINMTPMIDIVFQLLIFFVLTARFIEHEGELLSYLPKDRGQNAAPPPLNVNPLTIFLEWKGDPETGYCVARTNNYQPEGSSQNVRLHTFPAMPQDKRAGLSWQVANKRVRYAYPDYDQIYSYMQHRKARADAAGGQKLPVTINFEDKVPIQMVVNMLDICQKLKITDFAINATGLLD